MTLADIQNFGKSNQHALRFACLHYLLCTIVRIESNNVPLATYTGDRSKMAVIGSAMRIKTTWTSAPTVCHPAYIATGYSYTEQTIITATMKTEKARAPDVPVGNGAHINTPHIRTNQIAITITISKTCTTCATRRHFT